ncbi:MAG: flagellar protein [Agathobacter sp.]|nr:flagellar protein [Agathobacter sp.]
MEVKNCKGCGRLFNIIGSERLCPDCVRKLDEKFQQVKQYLDDNPNASVEDVSKDNDVTTKQIRKWVREERLIFAEGSSEGIDCEKCGKMIRTGRFCDACKASITNTLNSAIDKPVVAVKKKPAHEKDKMRFLS